jgi:N-glycosylase/DNA lyase
VSELRAEYPSLKPEIESKLKEFQRLWEVGSEDDLFRELAFCQMTPQSSAKACWDAVGRLFENGLFYFGTEDELAEAIHPIRFKYNKSRYMIEARRIFLPNGVPCIKRILSVHGKPPAVRVWIVQSVKGLGMKEASHFLRNIGLGAGLAILDRHILRTMKVHGVIRKIPDSISPKTYLRLEKAFLRWAAKLAIPPAHLDLLIWHQATGYLFK